MAGRAQEPAPVDQGGVVDQERPEIQAHDQGDAGVKENAQHAQPRPEATERQGKDKPQFIHQGAQGGEAAEQRVMVEAEKRLEGQLASLLEGWHKFVYPGGPSAGESADEER